MDRLDDSPDEITAIIRRLEAGDPTAKARLMDASYDTLRALANKLMQNERETHTLDPTELVHEAMLRVDRQGTWSQARHRGYFFGAMARAMRQTLVEHARRRATIRQGGASQRVPLDDAVSRVERSSGIDLLDLDDALTRLESLSPRQAEIVDRRLFAGQDFPDLAEHLGISTATVKRDWLMARAWLRVQLKRD